MHARRCRSSDWLKPGRPSCRVSWQVSVCDHTRCPPSMYFFPMCSKSPPAPWWIFQVITIFCSFEIGVRYHYHKQVQQRFSSHLGRYLYEHYLYTPRFLYLYRHNQKHNLRAGVLPIAGVFGAGVFGATGVFARILGAAFFGVLGGA